MAKSARDFVWQVLDSAAESLKAALLPNMFWLSIASNLEFQSFELNEDKQIRVLDGCNWNCDCLQLQW